MSRGAGVNSDDSFTDLCRFVDATGDEGTQQPT
jgi:hypothetical protein